MVSPWTLVQDERGEREVPHEKGELEDGRNCGVSGVQQKEGSAKKAPVEIEVSCAISHH